MFRIVLCFLIGLSMTNAQAVLASSSSANEEVLNYVQRYKDIAIDEMLRTGIPASIKLAQAVLESNAGRSHLAVQGNNHFGIKCGKYWQGRTIQREDDDYVNGKLIKSCFRAFPSASVSFKAHSEFLLDPKKDYRYGFLFKLDPMDYIAWAKGLKSAGYATNPKYPERLISIIERYALYQYDQLGLIAKENRKVNTNVIAYEEPPRQPAISTRVETVRSEAPVKEEVIRPTTSAPIEDAISTSTPVASTEILAEAKPEIEEKKTDFFVGEARSYTIEENNNIDFIFVSEGDNLQAIALEVGVDVRDLVEFNDYGYGSSQSLQHQTIVYIEEKKSKYSGSRETYRASKGETVFDIAQKFGIKASKLRARNKWDNTYQPKGGELVFLRGRKK